MYLITELCAGAHWPSAWSSKGGKRSVANDPIFLRVSLYVKKQDAPQANVGGHGSGLCRANS